MWTDRKQDSLAARASGGNPEPLADAAGKVTELTVIGQGMVIKGAIVSNESLHIDGEVEGKLDMAEHRLTVGPQARVGADTRAREVEILGKFDGDIDAAKKITIRKGGSLIGDLRTPAIVIEDGAYFKGRIEIVNSDFRPQIVRPQANAKKTASGV